jgi:hypothetical protein
LVGLVALNAVLWAKSSQVNNDEIIEELRASGVKLQEIEPEDISRAIQQCLDACKGELVSEAQARLCKSPD